MINIPAQFFWPGFVVGLLMLNVSMSFTILYKATSDEGPQVVPDYYQRSVHFEDEIQARMRFQDRGWDVLVSPGIQEHTVTILDGAGEPVEGVSGQVILKRPQSGEPRGSDDLSATSHAGVYTFEGRLQEPGRWYFDLHLEEAGEAIYVRRELLLR